MTRQQQRTLRKAARQTKADAMGGDERLRVLSTYKSPDGMVVHVRFNDGRTLPLSVAALNLIERHMGALS